MDKPLATRTRHDTYAELVQLAFPNPNDMRKTDHGWCEKPIPENNGIKTVKSTSVTTFKDSDPNPTIHSSTSELMSELWSKSRKMTSDRLNLLHISTIILLILLFIEAIIIIVLNKEDPQPCLTPGCIETSFQISHKLETSVDPCTDFYEFACGNYKKEIILEEHQHTRNIFTDVSETMFTRIEMLFNNSFSGPKHHKILAKLYQLCLDNNLNDIIMANKIITQLSSWPILEGIEWNPNNFHWTEVMVKSKKLGLPYTFFIEIGVQPNLYNTSKNIDCCTAPLIQAEKYLNETLRSINLGPISTEDIIQFVTFRNNIMKINEELHNEAPIVLTIKKLQDNFGGLEWMKYLKGLVEDTLSNDDELIVLSPSRVTKMLALLAKAQPRVLANYIFFELLEWTFRYTGKVLRMRHLQLAGETHLNRHLCIEDLLKSLSLPLYSLYSKKYFNNDTKTDVNELLINIRTELVVLLKSSEWLDEPSRNKSIEKVNAIAWFMGYPEDLLENHFLEAYYSKLVIDSVSYLNSTLLLNIFNENQKFGRLHQPSNKVMMVRRRDTSNIGIGYYMTYNSLDVMGATFPNLLFDIDFPKYLNYGKAGMIIANEIIHGVDNEGRKYDKEGNLNNWWSEGTILKYEKKLKCFIKQYDNLDKKIDGKVTLRENVADNAGLKISRLAYIASTKNSDPERRYAGLNYTQNQMFWIAFAQLWCSKSQYNHVDVPPFGTSPNKYRVIGTVSNMEEFSRDFNCPANSTMNPFEKCELW